MMTRPIPIVILAGSDRTPVVLPDSGRDKHPLSGYKGVAVRIGGRPLIGVVVDQLRAAGGFDPVYIAGPAAVYREFAGAASLIDTDGSFGENIRAAIDQVRRSHPPTPVGFATCDIVPDVETLKRLLVDYAASVPCDMWFPLVRAPERREVLGASAWKPAYRIVPEPGKRPVGILPGHLAICDPEALRLKFLYRLLDMGYRTRNRPIDARRSVMVRALLTDMLYQDLLHVLDFRLPALTWSVLRAALPAAKLLREGSITRAELEDALRRIFVKHRHRRRYPERRIHLPLVEALSLARDIDTEEEAREIGANVQL